MRKLIKIHIGLLVGFVISFFSTFIVVSIHPGNVNAYFPIAIFLTYEYLIINFLKDDFLTKEFKEKAKNEFSDREYNSVVIYRAIIKFALGVCIILAPIMWALAILS